MQKTYYYINNRFIESTKAMIPFNDVGFLYGDGLFETMRFDNKKIFSLEKHLARLTKGLEIINLKFDKSTNDLLLLLKKVIKKNTLNSGIIRLMITRGIINSEKNKPSIYISIKPFYEIPDSAVKVLYLDEQKYPIIRYTPAIKSMNYLGNMLAKKDADLQGAYEPIFYNKDNIITECAIRNIFYVRNNQVLTPSLDLGILSGVMRETIIDVVKSIGLDCIETHINFADIQNMDEAFISSTGIGLLPCFWEKWNSNFLITLQIKKELFKRINNN